MEVISNQPGRPRRLVLKVLPRDSKSSNNVLYRDTVPVVHSSHVNYGNVYQRLFREQYEEKDGQRKLRIYRLDGQ